MSNVPFINIEYIFYQIYKLFGGEGESLLVAMYHLVVRLADFIKPFSAAFSILLVFGIFYSLVKGQREEKVMQEKLRAAENVIENVSNKRWQKILEYIDSENESDWRLAILEADVILYEMLEKMGYHGETVSDKLRGVEKSDFLTVEKAWEAHKVRNVIAHEGGDFVLSNREARRAVSLYEEVFKEFRFI